MNWLPKRRNIVFGYLGEFNRRICSLGFVPHNAFPCAAKINRYPYPLPYVWPVCVVSVLIIDERFFLGQFPQLFIVRLRIAPEKAQLIKFRTGYDDDRESPGYNFNIQITKISL